MANKVENSESRAFWSLASNLGGYSLAIILGIIVARSIGPAGKGLISYAGLFFALLTTFGDGIRNAILSECGKNGRPIATAYATSLRILGYMMIPCVCLLLGVAMYVPAYRILAYVALALPFAIYAQIAIAVFMYENRIRTLIVQGAISSYGVPVVTIPAVLIWHCGVDGVLLIWALSSVAAAVYSLISLGSLVPRFDLRGDIATLQALWAYSIKATASSIADFLNLRIDVFIVGLVLDARMLGVYTLGIASGEMMWQISRPIVWTLIGKISTLAPEQSIALAAKIGRNVLYLQMMIGTALFVFSPWLIHQIYGQAYDQAGTVIRILIPGLILYASHGVFAYFLAIKRGRPLAMLSIQIVSISLCAAISLATLHRFGIYGAAAATTITYSFVAITRIWLFLSDTGLPAVSVLMLNSEDILRYRKYLQRALDLPRSFLGRCQLEEVL